MVLGDFHLCVDRGRFAWYDKDELVATVELLDDKGVKWVCGVYVSPIYRRHHIGSQVMKVAILLGGKRLRVAKSNGAATALYQKSGFTEYDQDKEYLYMKVEGT